MTEWISVEDGLPEYGERVLVSTNTFCGEQWAIQKNVCQGALARTDSRGHCFELANSAEIYAGRKEAANFVAHWMPLPPPPEGE